MLPSQSRFTSLILCTSLLRSCSQQAGPSAHSVDGCNLSCPKSCREIHELEIEAFSRPKGPLQSFLVRQTMFLCICQATTQMIVLFCEKDKKDSILDLGQDKQHGIPQRKKNHANWNYLFPLSFLGSLLFQKTGTGQNVTEGV